MLRRAPENDDVISISSVVGLPREEAIATVLQPEYEAVRPGILNIVLQLWAREDPAAAYASFKTLPEFEYSYLLEAQTLQLWLNSDPDTALSIAANSSYETTFLLVLQEAAHNLPEFALEAARTYQALMGDAEWRVVIEGIASSNPELSAQQVAAMHPDGAYLIDSFIFALARKDVVAAIQWLLSYYPDSVDSLESVASIFYIQDTKAAFDYISRIPAGPFRDSYEQALLQAQETNQASRYEPGAPDWVPMIDPCMTNGADRIECIKALPPDVLEDFQAWETRNGVRLNRARPF